MPEEAPVMTTTFPKMSSLKMGRAMLKRYLKKRYGGKTKINKVRDIVGIKMFIILLMISMA